MSGTIDLKLLATKALERLERSKAGNRIGTNGKNLVPRAEEGGTRNNENSLAILDLLVRLIRRGIPLFAQNLNVLIG